MGSHDPLRWNECQLEPRPRQTQVGDAEFPNPASNEVGALSAEVTRILDDVRHAIERNPGNAHAVALRLVAVLTKESPAAAASARGGLAPWQKRKIDQYLRGHFEQSIPLDDLARQISLSVSHFCRAFKQTFGTTPHAYIIQVRLEQAKELMLGTREPLSQIALASGLADQAHLTKLFRRAIGETPSAWRRRNLGDQPAGERSKGFSATQRLHEQESF